MPRRVWESDKDFRHKRGALARHFRRADTGGKKWHQLWSNRASLGLAAIGGLMTVWSALEGHIPLWIYMSVGVLGPVVPIAFRMLNQDKSDGSED